MIGLGTLSPSPAGSGPAALDALSPATARRLRGQLVAASASLAALVLGVGVWATRVEFSGAVVTSGLLVVESQVKKVQHPSGGVVGELRVRDGSAVRAGDVLVRLDATLLQANFAIVSNALDEALARRARLQAEQADATAITFPAELLARKAEAGRVMEAEESLLAIRRAALDGQKAQLAERIAQSQEQVKGLSEQIEAKAREVELIEGEIRGVRELWEKKLIPIQRVTALERDLVRIRGERGALVSEVAQTRGRISETRLQLIQLDQDMRTKVGQDLSEIWNRVAELVERKVSAQDQLSRVEIRAPQDGVVDQLAVHTVGGVVAAGETLMRVVPAQDRLAVEARLPPQDRDQTHPGQRAILRFSALNQRTTPEIEGSVAMISADVTTDPKTGQAYYTTRVAVQDDQLARLGDVKVAPGMPVEVFVQTQARTVLSYVTKPFADQVARAFREK
ncbi:HlyD family secretion protein [Methylobacterium sp. ap11]|uniref:HlyD family type I secretion periplasmic adaptor subunit n=1 Tax=Methylobacterium sp. ap11 TaxID=1761799 RepID=UPI0008BA290F|nr:HlyD family type I secretion periplasmic adaptor subunit [Methylobacterium sp. ap11]SEP30640.1 HlyD family secretion protein [Methylobacterium sp. ap11]